MKQHNVAVSHLVEHTNHVTFAKTGTFGSLHGRYVRDIAIVTNGIVIDEVAHTFYQAVVAHGNVTQRSVVDACMLGEALGDLYLFFKHTQSDFAIEYHSVEAVGRKCIRHHDVVPVLGPTAITLEHIDFLICQMSVISHKSIVLKSFFYLIQEVVVWILLHMQFAHLFI